MKHLRDVYQIFSTSKEGLNLADPRQNPFVQLTALDAATIISVSAASADKNNKLGAGMEALSKKHEKDVAETKTAIQMLEAKTAEREKRLQALEQGNEQLRKALVPSASSGPGPASSGPGPASAGPGPQDLQEQFKVASEEAARAQKLTQDLLTHFEKAKRRIGGT